MGDYLEGERLRRLQDDAARIQAEADAQARARAERNRPAPPQPRAANPAPGGEAGLIAPILAAGVAAAQAGDRGAAVRAQTDARALLRAQSQAVKAAQRGDGTAARMAQSRAARILARYSRGGRRR